MASLAGAAMKLRRVFIISWPIGEERCGAVHPIVRYRSTTYKLDIVIVYLV